MDSFFRIIDLLYIYIYICIVWGIHRSPVNFPHKGQWRGALMFSMICAWINGWVNNCEAGDLRRHRTRYEVTVMLSQLSFAVQLQWNLSETTTSMIQFITCDLFSIVFNWKLNVPIYSCEQFRHSGAHLGGPWPPRWAPECRGVSH